MTLLQVMPDDAPERVLLRTRDDERIAEALAECSVTLRRWPVRPLPADATGDAVVEAYRAEVDRLCAAEGLNLVDAVRMLPRDDEEWARQAAKARSAFLDEHRHSENEVRFFAEGVGCFYLHVGGKVYAVVCEAGDLLSVPAGTTHWFDMGPRPHFCAIRFFEREDGWVGDFTGDSIASGFPRLDALLDA
jgi:1,2-dihydroxy-3-keto-5-methylthiopentene dioxygenase